jgi:peptidyl-dipeptidase A
MVRKFLVTWIVLGATTGTAFSDVAGLVPTADDAKAFVGKVESDLEQAEEYANRASWVRNTNITLDTKWLDARASSEQASLAARYAKEAARFDSVQVDPIIRRKLSIIKRAIVLPPPSQPGASEELAIIAGRLSSKFSTNTVLHRGAEQTYNTINDILGSSRNPEELAFLWQAWRTKLPPMRDDYSRLVELANAGARELGYRDVGTLWRSQYDMPEADFARIIDDLWSQVEPLFKRLHCYVRARLNDAYGTGVQPRTGLIRADLLGHLSAWKWERIYEVIAPRTNVTSFDITSLLIEHNYDAEKVVKTAEHFYTSLGFAPLPQSFWERSMLTKPIDPSRKVACHPSAWSIDGRDDIRLKACFEPDSYSFYTAHHELGHNIYYRAYNEQPFLFKGGANDGFHEAIGDLIALYASTPTYLHQIGLLPGVPGPETDIPDLLRSALAHVAILPFGVIMDKWRWRVFSGETPPDKYNTDWWSLVRQYQGLVPPAPRPNDGFDPGAHVHVPTSVPYTRYFLAEVYQFQFYRAACRLAGWTGPLNRCSIFGNKEVGKRLNTMLQLGSSKPWPDALENFTSERDIDASAILEYFAPLDRWLIEQNKGENCGW